MIWGGFLGLSPLSLTVAHRNQEYASAWGGIVDGIVMEENTIIPIWSKDSLLVDGFQL